MTDRARIDLIARLIAKNPDTAEREKLVQENIQSLAVLYPYDFNQSKFVADCGMVPPMDKSVRENWRKSWIEQSAPKEN